MPRFSRISKQRLDTLEPSLRRILLVAIRFVDFSVLAGYRSDDEQDRLYNAGKSRARAGESEHNQFPSKAVDLAPYPIDWSDAARFAYLAGYIKALGDYFGTPVRWGGDWDGDLDFADNGFNDLGHFELIK